MADFKEEVAERVSQYAANDEFKALSAKFVESSAALKYMYNFFWMGRPIIQYPQDIVAFQEVVWTVKPDVIIETGIAHGGSLILSASLLTLLDYCEAVEAGASLDPRQSKRKVVGVDIDIRAHNRAAVEAHPMSGKIHMIEGSAIDAAVVEQVRRHVGEGQKVLVSLDSNHTHDHVLAELEYYAPLVSPGSYCVVFDTLIEDMPADAYPDRPWGPGDNPKTALREYLASHPEFEIDTAVHKKLQITVAPDGWLKRIA